MKKNCLGFNKSIFDLDVNVNFLYRISVGYCQWRPLDRQNLVYKNKNLKKFQM